MVTRVGKMRPSPQSRKGRGEGFDEQLALTVLLVVVFATAGCVRMPLPSDDSTLRIATSFPIENVDPIKPDHYFLVEYGVVELPLIRNEDNQIVPWLLDSYSRVDDLHWRLILRSNVQFQSGKQLTADSFAAAMNRQLTRSASTRAAMFDAKVTVTGERELTLTTTRPDPNVPAMLADEAVFPIYDVDAIESAGNGYEALLNCKCYTGPYQIVSLNERELALSANEKYWRGKPPLNSVIVRFVPDAQARVLAVQNGEVDVAKRSSPILVLEAT